MAGTDYPHPLQGVPVLAFVPYSSSFFLSKQHGKSSLPVAKEQGMKNINGRQAINTAGGAS